MEILKLHNKNQHTQAMGGSATERRCQVGQLTCLGQKTDWDTEVRSCDPCYNHFSVCLISWCQGEVCQYDMEKSSNARVARKETTDEATDVRSEHWGRGAELIGDKVAGLEKHVEAPEYDTEGKYNTDTTPIMTPTLVTTTPNDGLDKPLCEWTNLWREGCDCGRCITEDEAADDVCQDMGKSSKERVARKETTDEATDVRSEHRGRGAELIGDQVTGLEKHVEATDVVEESSGEEVAKGRVSFECGNCHYSTPTLKRSKATQKLRAHSRGCKAEHGAVQENPHPPPPAAVQEYHISGATDVVEGSSCAEVTAEKHSQDLRATKKQVSPPEGTLSSGGKIGFNTNREELSIPTVNACGKELEEVQEDVHTELF